MMNKWIKLLLVFGIIFSILILFPVRTIDYQGGTVPPPPGGCFRECRGIQFQTSCNNNLGFKECTNYCFGVVVGNCQGNFLIATFLKPLNLFFQ